MAFLSSFYGFGYHGSGFDSASRSCEPEDSNPLLLHDTPAFDSVLKVQWSRRYYCLDKHQPSNVSSDLDHEHSDPKFVTGHFGL